MLLFIDLLGFVQLQNIHVTAYSPMGTPPSSAMFKDYQPPLVMNDPVVKDLAKKYNKNVGQVQLTDSAIVADTTLLCKHPKHSAIPVVAQLCYVCLQRHPMQTALHLCTGCSVFCLQQW